MLSKDLSRLIQEQDRQQEPEEMKALLSSCREKPFWIWSSAKAGQSHRKLYPNSNCCFNHILGLPKKNGKEYGMFDYELILYKALMENPYLNSNVEITLPPGHTFAERQERRKILQTATYSNGKNKHLWCLKATGLGVTEFMLRFMVWLCMRNDDYRGAQMVIVTGPNIDMSIKLIKRIRDMFEPHGITFDSKETVVEINGCRIEAYPSNHIDAFRSLTNPKFILIEEGDFFRKNEQEEVRHVAERYIGKSDPYIVMVSTPNRPDGLFATIQKEPFETCIYKKVFLDHSYGVDKIYTKEEIAKAKLSPSFEREYCLKYQGFIGNVFSTNSIDRCITLGDKQEPVMNRSAIKYAGIDPGYGGAGICILQLNNNTIEVVYAEEFSKVADSFIVDKIIELHSLHHINCIMVDGSNPSIIEQMKIRLGENSNWKYIHDTINRCKSRGIENSSMRVIPVNFNEDGKYMLGHLRRLLDYTPNIVAINSKYEKLITGLRSAIAEEYKLDKTTPYNHLVDAARLAAKQIALNDKTNHEDN